MTLKEGLRAAEMAVLAALAGCSTGDRGAPLAVTGSDTMVILASRLAEGFAKGHPGVAISVTGGGTRAGVAALIAGSADVCMASRPMTPEERARVKERRGADAVETAVAMDAVVIYVHPRNKLTRVDVSRLKRIYSGGITDWKHAGGGGGAIVAYGSGEGSGTRDWFKDKVMAGDDFSPKVRSLPGTAEVVRAVAEDPLAIGYGGIAYPKGARALKIGAGGGPAVEPVEKAVVGGGYPLGRKLFFYTSGEPQGRAAEFISWVLSKDGVATCEETGYFPLKKSVKSRP